MDGVLLILHTIMLRFPTIDVWYAVKST